MKITYMLLVAGLLFLAGPNIAYEDTATFHVEHHHAIPTTIARLIACESGGKNIEIVDSNGLLSKGILQIQQPTWDEWSAESGIIGNPMVPAQAIEMAEWAIAHGELHRWSCAKILGMVQ